LPNSPLSSAKIEGSWRVGFLVLLGSSLLHLNNEKNMNGITPECYIAFEQLKNRDKFLTRDGWMISQTGHKNTPHSQKTIAIKDDMMHSLNEVHSAEAICRILLRARA